MDALECMLSRRSIRRYQPQPVSDATLAQILTAGVHAPSARNEQPWHFVVVDQRAMLDRIIAVHPYAGMLREAPVCICVCADTRLDQCPGGNYWIHDCAAATENILLAARALGLGSCWMGVYPRRERMEGVRQVLGLPAPVLPVNLVALGYPAETPLQPERSLTGRVHRNRWQDAPD